MKVYATNGAILSVDGKVISVARDLFWDDVPGLPITDGPDAWLAASKWYDYGDATNKAWIDKANAIFGNGGTGGAVTLASPIKVQGMTFNQFTGTYTVGTIGQQITLGVGIRNNSTGAVSIISPILLNSNTEFCSANIGSLSLTQPINNAGFNIDFDAESTGTVTVGISGSVAVISGAGGVKKYGVGRFNLGAAGAPTHTYSGATIIYAGVMMYSANLSANSNLVINGGILESYWSASLTRTLGSGAEQIQVLSGNSGFSLNGATSWVVTFNNNASFEVVWGSAFFQPTVLMMQSQYSSATSTITIANNIDLNGAARTIYCNSGTTGIAVSRLSGVIRNSTGTASLIKTGTGELHLTNASNTFNGNITISAGCLAVGGSVTATTGVLGAGSYSGTVLNNSCFIIGSTNAQVISGVISGTGTFKKIGSGLCTLDAANTFTGLTTVNSSGGTLKLSGSLAGSVEITVGVFRGPSVAEASCTISGSVSVANAVSAQIRPGTVGNNVMNIGGSLTFAGTSSRMTIDSTATTMSRVFVTGDVVLAGMGVSFNAGVTTNATYVILSCNGTMSGTLPSVITNPAGKTVTLAQVGKELRATVATA